MKSFKKLVFRLSVSGAVIFGFVGAVSGYEYDPEIGVIARITANILADQQYSHRDLDDKLSQDLYKEYMDMLDPAKLYFTKEDHAEFAKYQKELDDSLKKGDINFAFLTYNRLLKRMKEYQKFADETLEKGFDYTIDESFCFNRKDAEPPTAAEQKDLWRKRLKNDVLNFKLMERVAKENVDKTEEEKKKEEVLKLWKKSPEERIKNRIAASINILEKRKPVDRLEFFLTSLANVYDPHSSYMAPGTLEDFNISMKLSLVGIGAVLSSEDGYTKIVNIIKGGPASKNGKLEAEDRIIAVAQDGKPPVDIIDMPLKDVVQLIRGEKGTKVHLSVLKAKKGLNGVPVTITIVRDVVKLEDKSAQKEIKEVEVDGKKLRIGIIELSSFYTDFSGASLGKADFKSSTRDVKKILESFNKEKVDGVILDLRRNGGGGLREAIYLTGLFFDSGPVVQIKSVNKDIPSIEYDRDNKTFYDGPLVVMIDKLSASATEILAGAIQDYGRGIIVGDKHSHGKGTVQTIMDLDQIVKYYGVKFPAGALKLTNAKFYRINGDSTQIKGVTPDIIFPNFTDPMEIGEQYLDYALPWDTVKPAQYTYSKTLAELIPELRKKSLQRRAENPDFKKLKKNIELFDAIRKKKEVSLNEKKRWEEYKKEKDLMDKETALLKEEDDKKEKKKDVYIEETIKIITDLIKAQS